MKTSIIDTSELDEGLKNRWGQLRATNPGLRSPYFTWQYLDALAQVGRPIRIAVIEDHGQVQGFFSFEKGSGQKITPPGTYVTDFQGLITSPDLVVPMHEVLKACGTRYFHFDHCRLDQTSLVPYGPVRHVSPVMNLMGGWQAYLDRLGALQGKKIPGLVGRVKERFKIGKRTFGDIRLEFAVADHASLDWMMKFKSIQYQNTTGALDIFAIPWIRQLLHNLMDTHEANFKGVMSCLYGDETILGCHFGIQSQAVLHAWFPTYDTQYSQMGPGILLFHEMARLAQDNGVDTIDLGRGEQEYKTRFMTHAVELCEGVISRPQLWGNTTVAAWQAKQWLRQQHWARKAYQTIKSGLGLQRPG
jgi:CelD/BcsL family acetyltransferase involved in cellulose biosynthesis